MQTYEELMEEYYILIDKLFANEEMTEKEVAMLGRFLTGGGTFPDIPDLERDRMYDMTPDDVHESVKEMFKRTIEKSGRMRKNLEGWED